MTYSVLTTSLLSQLLVCNGWSCGSWMSLSLVTVMIGSILVGVGVDFSIHIANRIKELGGGIDAIKSAAVGTGMHYLKQPQQYPAVWLLLTESRFLS